MRELYAGVRASPVTFAILAGGLALQAVLVVLHGVNKELLGDANFLALDKDNNLTGLHMRLSGQSILASVRPAVVEQDKGRVL